MVKDGYEGVPAILEDYTKELRIKYGQVKLKVKQSRYKPGVAHRVPGS